MFISASELLEMYSIDINRNGARDFIDMTELYSLALVFKEYEITFNLLLKIYMRKLKLSPLVFWGRMKRDILPILTADNETLAALGCPMPEQRTCPELIKAVAAALADKMNADGDIEKYRDIAKGVRDLCAGG